jgi:cell division protein FtsW (lipid II flippase)
MDTATSVTEMFVGLVCVGLAFAAPRRNGATRWIGITIGVLGVVAIAHAVVLLLRGWSESGL